MGLGPSVIELYRQLKLHGALEGVANVMELGSQDFWCPQKNLFRGLFSAFGLLLRSWIEIQVQDERPGSAVHVYAAV